MKDFVHNSANEKRFTKISIYKVSKINKKFFTKVEFLV